MFPPYPHSESTDEGRRETISKTQQTAVSLSESSSLTAQAHMLVTRPVPREWCFRADRLTIVRSGSQRSALAKEKAHRRELCLLRTQIRVGGQYPAGPVFDAR